VFLITDDDNPTERMDATKSLHQVTISTRSKMRVRRRFPFSLVVVVLADPFLVSSEQDLSELGAEVVPFFLTQPDKTFDPSKFWDVSPTSPSLTLELDSYPYFPFFTLSDCAQLPNHHVPR